MRTNLQAKKTGRIIMGKKLVVSFPGNRGAEIPLLYFGAKHFEDEGYEKIFLYHPDLKGCDFESIYDYAKKEIKKLNLNGYEDVVFIGKSIGTVTACKIKEELGLAAVSLILLTPLLRTLPYIHKDNKILLVAAGDRDRYLDSEKMIKKCKSEGVRYYVEKGVGHRMEAAGDLSRNLAVIENVIGGNFPSVGKSCF